MKYVKKKSLLTSVATCCGARRPHTPPERIGVLKRSPRRQDVEGRAGCPSELHRPLP